MVSEWDAAPQLYLFKEMSSTTGAAAESRRNVEPLDNTVAPVGKMEAFTSQKPLLYLWCDY